MNKQLFIIIIAAIVLAGGVGYEIFLSSQKPAVVPIPVPVVATGKVREVMVSIKKESWAFTPDSIDVVQGEKVVVTVVNEDEFDHGFAIDAFGVQQRVSGHQTIKIEFTPTQTGDFLFYCSIPCGQGMVDGKKRTHFDMVGTLHVKSASK